MRQFTIFSLLVVVSFLMPAAAVLAADNVVTQQFFPSADQTGRFTVHSVIVDNNCRNGNCSTARTVTRVRERPRLGSEVWQRTRSVFRGCRGPNCR